MKEAPEEGKEKHDLGQDEEKHAEAKPLLHLPSVEAESGFLYDCGESG